MKYQLTTLLTCALIFAGCQHAEAPDPVKVKDEIVKAEKDFEKMVAEKGISEGFAFYADEQAVIRRGKDSIIHGKEGIRHFYEGDYFKTASVKWTPDFVDVSANGDMAYTYGHYTWQAPDSTGKMDVSTGIFHTVWKRQADGSWKYVWD